MSGDHVNEEVGPRPVIALPQRTHPMLNTQIVLGTVAQHAQHVVLAAETYFLMTECSVGCQGFTCDIAACTAHIARSFDDTHHPNAVLVVAYARQCGEQEHIKSQTNEMQIMGTSNDYRRQTKGWLSSNMAGYI